MKRTILRLAAATAAVLTALFAVPAQADLVPMGTVRGWTVLAITDGATTIRCAAAKPAGQRHMRLVTDGATWWAAIDMTSQKTGPGHVRVDGAGAQVNYQYDGQFSYVRLNSNWLGRVARGNWFTFDLGHAQLRVSLVGTQAAIQRLRQCANRIPFAQRGQGFSEMASGGAGGGQSVVPMPAPVQPMPAPIQPLPGPVVPMPVQPVPMPGPVVPMPVQPVPAPVTPAPVQPAPITPAPAPAAGMPCPVQGTVASAPTNQAVTVTFDVQTVGQLTLYWVDTTGNAIQLTPLAPGVQTRQGSIGDVYLAKDTAGMCHGGALFVSPQMTTFRIE